MYACVYGRAILRFKNVEERIRRPYEAGLRGKINAEKAVFYEQNYDYELGSCRKFVDCRMLDSEEIRI